MGVYINMEMPTSCYDCDFVYQDKDSEHNVYWTCAAVHKSACMHERRDDCPLIPIPEHGRLIDADALLMQINHEVMEAYMDGACYGAHPSSEHLYLLGEIIDDAPTIIAAEEDE